MLKRNWKKMLKSRKMAWMLLACLAAGAAAGTVYKNSRPEKDIAQVAERTSEQKAQKESNDSDAVAADDTNQVRVKDEEKTGKKEDENKTQEKEKQENNAKNSGETAPASGNAKAKKLNFLKNSTLSWPVQGEVLLEFNMDETVYFPTLNLYKCSEGMIIQSEKGTPVCAPADALIVSVGTDEQIGNYLVMDVGDGYQVKLGQLKDIEVSEGDLVEEGSLLAYVAAPSKCYSVEGDNLYLALTDNGKPSDPLNYLK